MARPCVVRILYWVKLQNPKLTRQTSGIIIIPFSGIANAYPGQTVLRDRRHALHGVYLRLYSCNFQIDLWKQT